MIFESCPILDLSEVTVAGGKEITPLNERLQLLRAPVKHQRTAARRHYPVTLAVERGYADILRIILSVPGDRVDLSVEVDGDNLAWLAVKNSDARRQLRCMKLLCKDERVDWNTRDVAGNTPLLFCLKGNQLEMARLLLGTPRVDLHVKDGDGKYPEMIARFVFTPVGYVYFYLCVVQGDEPEGDPGPDEERPSAR